MTKLEKAAVTGGLVTGLPLLAAARLLGEFNKLAVSESMANVGSEVMAFMVKQGLLFVSLGMIDQAARILEAIKNSVLS